MFSNRFFFASGSDKQPLQVSGFSCLLQALEKVPEGRAARSVKPGVESCKTEAGVTYRRNVSRLIVSLST